MHVAHSNVSKLSFLLMFLFLPAELLPHQEGGIYAKKKRVGSAHTASGYIFQKVHS